MASLISNSESSQYPTVFPNAKCDRCGRIHTTAIRDEYINKVKYPDTAMPDDEFHRLLDESMQCLKAHGTSDWAVAEARSREMNTKRNLPRSPRTD